MLFLFLIDFNDISDTVKRIQSEKAFSLDNLYNLDDSINSESNVQKRKYANLNLKSNISLAIIKKKKTHFWIIKNEFSQIAFY